MRGNQHHVCRRPHDRHASASAEAPGSPGAYLPANPGVRFGRTATVSMPRQVTEDGGVPDSASARELAYWAGASFA